MRKQNYLHLSEKKDGNAMRMLVNCRHCTKEQLLQVISKNRLDNYLKEKIIQKIETQNNTVYLLTDKGYKQFGAQLDMQYYRYHSQAISHDIELSQQYLDLLKSGKQFTWKNEEQLKAERREEYHKLYEQGKYSEAHRLMISSCPDAVVSHDGITYGFDVLTDNYSNQAIIEKAEYCELHNIDFQFSRV